MVDSVTLGWACKLLLYVMVFGAGSVPSGLLKQFVSKVLATTKHPAVCLLRATSPSPKKQFYVSNNCVSKDLLGFLSI